MNHMKVYTCRSCEHATEQLGIKYCLKVNRALDTKTIDYVGCASHNDFETGDPTACVCGLKDEQCKEKDGWIKQDARKELLDELGMYLDAELEKASQFNAMRNFAFLDVKRKIEEIRQENGGEGKPSFISCNSHGHFENKQDERDNLLNKLVEMIDAHAENWTELCELQELVQELRRGGKHD